jgi:hypothetical protein
MIDAKSGTVKELDTEDLAHAIIAVAHHIAAEVETHRRRVDTVDLRERTSTLDKLLCRLELQIQREAALDDERIADIRAQAGKRAAAMRSIEEAMVTLKDGAQSVGGVPSP